MFEHYTEKARRTIFFGRYEASEFGSPYIETEHLLLGLLRDDKVLANRYLRSPEAGETIRKQIESHTGPREKISTSVDLPLSPSCQRALTYAAEEAERLSHKHIGTEHLLLGLLREESCFAAHLLGDQGLTVDSMRERLLQWQRPPAPFGAAWFPRLDEWLAECQRRGFSVVMGKAGTRGTLAAAIYVADPTKEDEKSLAAAVAAKLGEIQNRIAFAVDRMENAVANHEFEKARFYAEKERKEREDLRLLREQFHLEELPLRIPLLYIEIISNERFSDVQRRWDRHIAEGVPQVWLLDHDLKRAYTVKKIEGLRECKSGILQIANPPLEMDLKTIFE